MLVHTPPHPASLAVDELMRACHVERGRSRKSGPGGQHRNKVETGIEITHDASGVTGWASERREQSENLKVAQFRLRVSLALEVRTERDLVAGPSELWRSRTQAPRRDPRALGNPSGGSISCNPAHADFPALLAEALDVLWMKRWDPKLGAVLLGVTLSQLVRFVAKEPRALELVNAGRAERGLHAMKA